MTATVMQRYTLDNFEKFIADGFEANLPQESLAIIQELASKVGAPEYVRTPQFQQRQYNDHGDKTRGNRRRKQKTQELSDDAWEAIRNFESTQMQKREGIDASIDLIRKAMNKIADKTYDVLSKQIIDEIKKVADVGEETRSDLEKIAASAFDIASTNGFYSGLYARIYAELCQHFGDIFVPPLKQAINSFKDSYRAIEYVSPDEDYDKFCVNNKENTKRRAIGVFFIKMAGTKFGVDIQEAVDIIRDIQTLLEEKINEEGQEAIVDELACLEAEIILGGKAQLAILDEWEEIAETIARFAKMKARDHLSLTNKTVFKHMDIQDALK
jgi:hypothetical protein